MPLIRTRQGACAYLIAPLLLFLLFFSLLLTGVSHPFGANLFVDFLPAIILLMALMAFALPALAVLTRWGVAHVFGTGRPGLGMALAYIPAALLMWIPAAVSGIPLWLWTLVSLLRRRYPVGQPLRLTPVLVVLAVILVWGLCATGYESWRCSQPAATAEAAYRLYNPDAAILAQLANGEDEMLIISMSGSGVFARSEKGWTLKTAYQTDLQHLMSLDGSGSMVICRNPDGGEDVVIVTLIRWKEDEKVVPEDTAGSVFIEDSQDLGFAVSCTYYALVDADAPDYTVTLK